MKASCGMLTLPIVFIRCLPAFCFHALCCLARCTVPLCCIGHCQCCLVLLHLCILFH